MAQQLVKTIHDRVREALALKVQKVPAHEIARRLAAGGRDDGYEVSSGGSDQFPELTFEKQGHKEKIVCDPADGGWKPSPL